MTDRRLAPRPVAASAAIAPLLRGPTREVRVVAAFRPAVYLAVGSELVVLVAADGIRHPNAVVDPRTQAVAPFAGLRVHQRGAIGDGALTLPDRHLRVARWFDPHPRLTATDPATVRTRSAALTGALHDHVGDLPEELVAGRDALTTALADADGVAARSAAGRLLGWGPGLTPAGDDVLAGLFAAVATLAPALEAPAAAGLAREVRELGTWVTDAAEGRTTAVSASLLRHAVRGEVAAPVADLLDVLVGRGDPRTALLHLLAVGSTSGRDLAMGLLTGAELVARVTDRRPVGVADPAAPVAAPPTPLSVPSPAPTTPLPAR